MLRRLIGEDIELALVTDSGAGRVRVDPGQLEQVVVNLVVNARDAMPEGGQLTLETRTVEVDEAWAARHVDVRPGRYVMLAVSDSGVGMSRDVQARIFDPFFTTKDEGRGTGLGLATVYGIVKQSGGHVCVSSKLGAGTTFRIYLPRTEAALDAVPARGANALQGGTETILLVEDEAEVRSLASELLQQMGYTVLEAALPTDAMSIVDQHVGRIDVVLTDVIMPRMSGPKLAAAIAAARPETKILFMSGYAGDAIARHGMLERARHFLEKPFTPATLAAKVREVLDAHGSVREDAGGRGGTPAAGS
jgi:CheY-like chemotaxis protein